MSRAARWLAAFLVLGLAWRGVRYALGFPIWQDEAYLGVSILRGDYAHLFREPLAYLQIAPLGFLWLQRFVVEQLGGGESAVRLAPLLAGAATLLLFARFAWQRLPRTAAAIAVGVFAVSYVLVRHSVEAKQYATDALLATLLLQAGSRWQTAPHAAAAAGGATLIAGIGVWFSYPLVLVAGGVGIALLPTVWRRSAAGARVGWCVYAAVVAASFGLFYAAFASQQSARAAGTWLERYWQESFPPRDSLLGFAHWLLDVHTGKMLAYPLGGGSFASTGTLLLCIAGAAALVRTGRGALLGLLLAPLAPALIAALLHKYPYGGSARVCIYLAPAICALVGMGAYAILVAAVRRGVRSRLALHGACGALALIAPGGIAVDVLRPYKEPQYAAARAALRDVATYVARPAAVCIANAMHDRDDPPDGPEFHPTLLYYLVLYTNQWPHFCNAQPPPADVRWMLTFYGATFGPQPARLAELLAPRGMRPVLHRDYRLSSEFDWRLGVYRCEPLAASSDGP